MVDSLGDIARQAREGSVSAIIQILNEKLADSGVRTRAMFDQGILQLLCEAAKPEQLEQPVLVPHVRQILESLQPRNIRRVNINSRIVREQQLLWLDELNRDPDSQLLWSEEITLAKPTFLQRLVQDRQGSRPGAAKATLPKASPVRVAREKRVFWRGLVGGASLSLFMLLVGWALHNWLSPRSAQSQLGPVATKPGATSSQVGMTEAAIGSSPISASSELPPEGPSTPKAGSQADAFAQAVRLAEDAATVGQSAQTSADWLEIASRWQRASDLMSQVPQTDPRYATAQDRVERYRQNSQTALQQAEAKQQ